MSGNELEIPATRGTSGVDSEERETVKVGYLTE